MLGPDGYECECPLGRYGINCENGEERERETETETETERRDINPRCFP